MASRDDPKEDPHHPRRRATLIGHRAAEQRLLSAHRSGKLHHAWILCGPHGLGKATLAYRFARFLLRRPNPQAFAGGAAPEDLAVAESDPVFRRVASGGHADLLTIEREWDEKNRRLRPEIQVDVARRVPHFFALTAGEGGWRICIVDPADRLNEESQNALLKILEEPPSRSLLLLVTDVAGRLLRTIRSRCMRLELAPLRDSEVEAIVREVIGPAAMPAQAELDAAVRLAQGSPGRALELVRSGGLALFKEFNKIVATLPHLAIAKAVAFADRFHPRAALDDYLLFCELMVDWLGGEVLGAVEGRVGLVTPASVPAWLAAHQEIAHSIRRAVALNLDRRQVVMQALNAMEEAARAGARRAA